MELESPPLPSSPLLVAIQELKRKGFNPLVFSDGIDRWDMRARCLLLLAGASHLVDSGQSGFENELTRLLSKLLRSEAEQETEERELVGVMAGLGLVGSSRAIVEVYRNILRISVLSDLPTLLTGETGTGKELLAHAIHALDPKRGKGPFVPLNCAAL